jgi:hypothetical protein
MVKSGRFQTVHLQSTYLSRPQIEQLHPYISTQRDEKNFSADYSDQHKEHCHERNRRQRSLQDRADIASCQLSATTCHRSRKHSQQPSGSSPLLLLRKPFMKSNLLFFAAILAASIAAAIGSLAQERDVQPMTSRTDPLPVEGALPSLAGATGWLNSQPLTPQTLRGKVVLVDFWTYTCIN